MSANVRKKPRIALFVDVQNIYYTCRDTFGKSFDYRALIDRLDGSGDLVIANAYATDRSDDGQIKFQDALRHMGFTVKLKPWIKRRDGSAKADWDVGITIDVLDAAATADEIVLLSGDGDFDMLLAKVREDWQTKTTVYGVRALTAQALIDAADTFHAIDDELLR